MGCPQSSRQLDWFIPFCERSCRACHRTPGASRGSRRHCPMSAPSCQTAHPRLPGHRPRSGQCRVCPGPSWPQPLSPLQHRTQRVPAGPRPSLYCVILYAWLVQMPHSPCDRLCKSVFSGPWVPPACPGESWGGLTTQDRRSRPHAAATGATQHPARGHRQLHSARLASGQAGCPPDPEGQCAGLGRRLCARPPGSAVRGSLTVPGQGRSLCSGTGLPSFLTRSVSFAVRCLPGDARGSPALPPSAGGTRPHDCDTLSAQNPQRHRGPRAPQR